MRNELNIIIEKELSIIAIVGEQMKNTPGISANLFSLTGTEWHQCDCHCPGIFGAKYFHRH